MDSFFYFLFFSTSSKPINCPTTITPIWDGTAGDAASANDNDDDDDGDDDNDVSDDSM